MSLAVMVGMVRVKLPTLGVVGPWRVSVPAPPESLKVTAPVAVEAVPRVRAEAPWMVTVPVKLAAELMV